MLDGLPAHLEPHLPPGDPRSVSAAYWFTEGSWQMGRPAPAADEPGPFLSDPQGVRGLIGALLDADARELVAGYYERPELAAGAQRLMDLADRREPLEDDALRALEPVDGIEAMRDRARELGLR